LGRKGKGSTPFKEPYTFQNRKREKFGFQMEEGRRQPKEKKKKRKENSETSHDGFWERIKASFILAA